MAGGVTLTVVCGGGPPEAGRWHAHKTSTANTVPVEPSAEKPFRVENPLLDNTVDAPFKLSAATFVKIENLVTCNAISARAFPFPHLPRRTRPIGQRRPDRVGAEGRAPALRRVTVETRWFYGANE